jgi:multidrug transporter EmrE-like cation transporter
MNNLPLILLSAFLGSVGQVILKIGANRIGELDILKLIKTPEIVLGLFFFGFSFLLWIKVLTKSDLSYAYPLISLGYINVVISSYFLFNEPISVSKLTGIILIILGVIFLNK